MSLYHSPDFKLSFHYPGHSTHFQIGGDNPKVERGILQNHQQNKTVFYFHFDNFIFENKVTGGKMSLNRQIAQCTAAVECPDYPMIIYVDIE